MITIARFFYIFNGDPRCQRAPCDRCVFCTRRQSFPFRELLHRQPDVTIRRQQLPHQRVERLRAVGHLAHYGVPAHQYAAARVRSVVAHMDEHAIEAGHVQQPRHLPAVWLGPRPVLEPRAHHAQCHRVTPRGYRRLPVHLQPGNLLKRHV